MTKGTVTAPEGLRIRSAPNTQGHRLGVAPNGSTVHIVETVDGWHRVELWPDRGADATVSGWVSAQYVVTETPPVPEKGTSAAYLLGIHQLADKAKARESLQNGARAVMVFEDATLAHQLSLAHPDAIVMHRKYFQHAPSPRDMIAQHGVNPDETGNPTRAWYRGINEFDAPGYDGDAAGILKRAAWDLECAAILKRAAPNARWIAGGFSHGTPDFTSPGICEAVRRGYADAYNRGDIALDIHNYSKAGPNGNRDYAYYAPIWFERRWEFLFTHCGFHVSQRAIVATEAGAELGAGGFRWANYSTEEFASWAARYLSIQRQPLAGKPSPFIASTLFQWGDQNNGPGGWWGYGVDAYIAHLRGLWQATMRPIPASMSVVAGHVAPYSVPPAKVMR